jgi:hypothetical protein
MSTDPSTFADIGPGPLFGSEVPYRAGSTFDLLPASHQSQIANSLEVLGWPVFDHWVNNRRPTQGVFLRTGPDSFRAQKISHSACLSWQTDPVIEWNASDNPYFLSAKAIDAMAAVRTAIIQLASTPGTLEDIVEVVCEQFEDTFAPTAVAGTLRHRADMLPCLLGQEQRGSEAAFRHKKRSVVGASICENGFSHRGGGSDLVEPR